MQAPPPNVPSPSTKLRCLPRNPVHSKTTQQLYDSITEGTHGPINSKHKPPCAQQQSKPHHDNNSNNKFRRRIHASLPAFLHQDPLPPRRFAAPPYSHSCHLLRHRFPHIFCFTPPSPTSSSLFAFLVMFHKCTHPHTRPLQMKMGTTTLSRRRQEKRRAELLSCNPPYATTHKHPFSLTTTQYLQNTPLFAVIIPPSPMLFLFVL